MTELSPARLDAQYNARAAIADHQQIFARWRSRSERARNTLRCELDFYYGSSPAETLDVFHADAPGAPLLIFIHGGYWRSLDKSDFSFLAPALVDAGVSLAVVNYGLLPAVPLEEIVQQMLRACAWCWRNAQSIGVEPGRIYVSGHSAGGHLTAMMLAAEWSIYAPGLPADLVRGGLAISGIYDLAPLARAPFIREDLRLDEAAAARLSPVSYMPRRNVPLYTCVGGDESDEFHRQNLLIANTWPHCFAGNIPMPGHHHLSVVEQLGNPNSELFRAALRMMGVR
ncbi:MAG: alpha/beta hydrolase [Pseudomonadota bacterium]|jgi:arylformamidase